MNAEMLADQPDVSAISVSERFVPGPKGAPDVRVLVLSANQRLNPEARLALDSRWRLCSWLGFAG
jgi:hypothetical protein